jgi:hypothetical protein
MKPLGFCLAASLVALGVILAVSWTPTVGAQPLPTLRYSGQLFKFQHHRMVFIDTVDRHGVPIDDCPIIIDKKRGSQDSATYEKYRLTKSGAFILRFVLQHVDPLLIKPIYMAEYNVNEATAITDINNFLDALTRNHPPILRRYTRAANRGRPDNPQVQPPVRFSSPLRFETELDVDMNQMGGGGYKIPPPPPPPPTGS